MAPHFGKSLAAAGEKPPSSRRRTWNRPSAKLIAVAAFLLLAAVLFGIGTRKESLVGGRAGPVGLTLRRRRVPEQGHGRRAAVGLTWGRPLACLCPRQASGLPHVRKAFDNERRNNVRTHLGGDTGSGGAGAGGPRRRRHVAVQKLRPRNTSRTSTTSMPPTSGWSTSEILRSLQQRRLRLVRFARRPGDDQPPRRRRYASEDSARRARTTSSDGFHAKTRAEEIKSLDDGTQRPDGDRGRDRAASRRPSSRT